MYSFIVPRKKATIDTFTYFWLLFILFTSIVLIGVGFYIESENSKFNIYKSEIKNKLEETAKKKAKLEKSIDYYKKVHNDYILVQNSNEALKNAIRNLLSFIPDQIIINKMLLQKYEVKIYGYIDSPKTYKLLLEPPLKSIFDKTKVGFTKIEDGKYLFSSYNKIKRVSHEEK